MIRRASLLSLHAAALLAVLALSGGSLPAQEPDPFPPVAGDTEEGQGASGLRTLATVGAGGDDVPAIAAQEIQEVEKGVYRLSGYADIQFGTNRLQADEVVYDSNTGIAEAEGNVVLIQGDGSLAASRLRMNLETGEATLWDVSGYTPPYYQFRAGRMERINEELFWIYDAVFTTCTQPVPYWSFKVKKARVRLEHYARLYHASYRNNNVPWLYVPTMLWPVKQERASGVLMPQVGASQQRGYFLGTATYWAMRRNMDATFFVDYYSIAEWAGGLEYRYVPNALGEGRFIGYILPHDVDPARSERWFYHYDGDQRFGDGWRLIADLNGISDDEFYRDFDRELNFATRPNEFSTLYLTRSWSYYTLDFRTERNEQFFDSGNVLQQRLPEAEIRSRSQRLGGSPLYLSFLGSVNNLARQEPGLDAGYQRYDAGATLSAKLTPAPWMDLTPSLSVRDTYYTQRADPASPTGISDEPLNRPNYAIGLDVLGPKIFRIFEPEEGAAGSRYKNVIEPRVSYTFIPEFDERSDVILYDEVDTIPTDLSLLTYSLSTRLLRKRPLPKTSAEEEQLYESASEIASLSIAQSYSFNSDLTFSSTLDDRSSFGPVVLLGRYNPTRSISADLRLDYDVLFNKLSSISVSANASSPRLGRLVVSYFVNRSLETDPLTGERPRDSGTLRVGGGSAVFRKKLSFDVDIAYDLRGAFLQSQRYRIGYQTQCCGFSIEYLKNEFSGLVDPNEELRFMVSLQGVGTFLDLNSRL